MWRWENIITSPVAIVEFKRPKRTNYPDTENPIMQALIYAKKILEGKYEMPDGEGFFGYVKDFNAYVEIKSCKKSYL